MPLLPNIGLESGQGPLELRAGPMELLYENGLVRSIFFDGTEVVRRIYMAVRDEYWNTIPGELTNFSLEKNAASFALSFDSRHRRASVDFAWHGRIDGEEGGRLVFSMRGSARSSFRRKRIGLCVLHPLTLCKDSLCRIESIDGTVADAAFPASIAPQQVFRNIRTMRYSGGRNACDVALSFAGEPFETEDQRNWTDERTRPMPPRSLKTRNC